MCVQKGSLLSVDISYFRFKSCNTQREKKFREKKAHFCSLLSLCGCHGQTFMVRHMPCYITLKNDTKLHANEYHMHNNDINMNVIIR